MAAPRTFCLCADDYAMTPGVSRGIREAMDAGAVTATSAMTTSPWWPDEGSRLAPYRARASLGLHINLTQGAPLASMPRFAPHGRLPDIGTLLRRSRSGQLPVEEIAAEIERQFVRFVSVMGHLPDHIDGHQHVHVLGGVRAPMLAVLARQGFAGWVRDSSDQPVRIVRRWSELKKAVGVAVLAHGFADESRGAGLATNRGFAGYSAFEQRRRYADEFRRYLVAPGPRHLVMCHPGYVDDALRGLDPVVERREQELAFLLSAEFRKACDAARMRPALL